MEIHNVGTHTFILSFTFSRFSSILPIVLFYQSTDHGNKGEPKVMTNLQFHHIIWALLLCNRGRNRNTKVHGLMLRFGTEK